VRRWVGMLVVAWALAQGAAHAGEVPVDLELVLAVDVSGSIDPVEARLQRDGYMRALTDPRIANAVRSGPLGRIALTYVEWAGDHYQRQIIGWTAITGSKDLGHFASELERHPFRSERRTSLSAAIDFSVALFDNNGFEGTRRVIDISGDGYNNAGRSVLDARDNALARGIVINGLPILNDRVDNFGGTSPLDLDIYFENNVIGGPGSFMVVARDFGAFAAAILAKLIREIASLEGE
jgi:Protein of unknown function (DUF1194)